MTDPTTSPNVPGTSSIDRRWFEETLRSHGFVVEPPAIDTESRADRDGHQETVPTITRPAAVPATTIVPRDATPGPRPSGPTPPSHERPALPSALLARIAARSSVDGSMGRTTRAEPSPTHPEPVIPGGSAAPQAPVVAGPIATAETIADDTTVAVPAPDRSGATDGPSPDEAASPAVAPPIGAPRAGVVVATVAPWSTPGESGTLSAAAEMAPAPDATPAPVGTPAATASPAVAVPPAAVRPPDAAIVTPRATDAGRAEPLSTVEPSGEPEGTLLARGVSHMEVGPGAPAPSAATPHTTGASDGELWALVESAQPSAGLASGSESLRVVLTILTALLVLAAVVGSLVLVSQLA